MSNLWYGDYKTQPTQSRGPGSAGRGRRGGGGGGGGAQWRAESQGRTASGGQCRSGYGLQHGSTNTVATGGGRGWGNGGGVMRGQGGGGHLEGGGGGEGGRMAIRDLVPHQPNTMIIGIVITKQSVHSFPDKKNPGVDRFKFALTMRDSPSDYVNVTCWGSEAYIRSLVDSFKICDVVELRNAQILSKLGGENEERWRPWTSSGHQLNATEGHSTISLYSGWDYTDFTALAHIPLRPPNDYYPLSDILSSGQALEGSHINILAIVRYVSAPKQMTSRSGKPLKKCEVKLMDDACSSFSLTIWDEELIDLAQTWTPKENIIFAVDVKVSFNSYTNSMVASCDKKTIITTNPDCREAHQLYQYAQSLGDLGGGEEDREWAGNASFIDISTVTKVHSIEELVSSQASGKEGSFSGILYAILMSLNIDNDPTRTVSLRCTMCKMRAQPSSGQCSNNFCPSHSSSSSSFATEPHFSLPIALSDHTAGLEGVRLAGKAAEDLLKLTPDEFLNSTPEQRMALKHSLQLERYKVYFKSGVVSGESRRPLVRVLSINTARPDEVVTQIQPVM